MSNLKLLSSKEALKRQMERIEKRKGKRVAHVPIPRVQETINVESSNPVELATKKKKRPGSDDESSSINVKFSSDVYVYLNLGLKLNSPEDLPEDEHDGDVPEYVPRETQGPDDEPNLTGDVRDLGGPTADEATTQVDDPVYSKLKGKKKVEEPSEPVAFSCGTSSFHPVTDEPDATSQGAEAIREPLGMMAPEILAPTESIPTPSVGGGVELRHPDLDYEDPTADLNTRA
ncbi:hypothetical protein LWI29_011642 [Acer saccharum]|uniref:Uncharacterized protein n=1 Tax=Acer saccharum TaxID=4024 RepID=A0AA39VFF5_ACESA|nr:hypothetical protein LWI29_011642 [Acer saccharum]